MPKGHFKRPYNFEWLPELDEIELAWAAGFFDGEGTASTMGGRPYLQVRQKDTRLLYRFQRAVGGRGIIFEDGSNGVSRWRSTKIGESISILNRLWPYLGPQKKEQFMGVI